MMTSCWKIMISLSLFRKQLIWSKPDATFYMHDPEFLLLKKIFNTALILLHLPKNINVLQNTLT